MSLRTISRYTLPFTLFSLEVRWYASSSFILHRRDWVGYFGCLLLHVNFVSLSTLTKQLVGISLLLHRSIDFDLLNCAFFLSQIFKVRNVFFTPFPGFALDWIMSFRMDAL